MTTPSTDEARELALVDKVEFRIALADSDAKLEAVLKTFLPPLLLKLASQHASSRKKVTAICQSLNVRVQPRDIQLPVQSLVKQFKQNPGSSYVRHFDLLYIQKGLGRLSGGDRAAILPELIPGIAEDVKEASSQGASVFNLFLKALLVYQFPPRGSEQDEQLRTSLNISSADAQALSFWICKLLLLPTKVSAVPNQSSVPGLSLRDIGFLTLQGKEGVWDPSAEGGLSITESKQATLRALTSGMFVDSERLFPALIASADTNAKVFEAGDEILKKTVAGVRFEDGSTVSDLYDLYFGNVAAASSQDDRRMGTAIPIRMKILGLLQRSKESTRHTQKIIELAQQNLLTQQATDQQGLGREASKLSSATIAFLTFVARQANSEDLSNIARAVIELLKDFLDQHSNAHAWDLSSIRGKSFEVVGLLASSNSQLLLEPNLALLTWLFRSLAEEPNKEVVFSIDGAISSTLRTFQEPKSDEVKSALRSLLLRNLTLNEGNMKNVRYATVRLANQSLPFHDVSARWVDMVALAEASEEGYDIAEEAQRGLDPYWYRLMSTSAGLKAADQENLDDIDQRCKFPGISELVHYTLGHQEIQAHGSKLLQVALNFCRQALVIQALEASDVAIEINFEWTRKLDLAMSEGVEARAAVRRYLVELSSSATHLRLIMQLWQSALHGLLSTHSQGRDVFSNTALELCTLSPDSTLDEMAPQFRSLEKATTFNDITARTASARCYGLLASVMSLPQDELRSSITTLFEQANQWHEAIGTNANKSHGAIIALAFLVARRAHRTHVDALTDDIRQRFLPLIFQVFLQAHDILMLEASYQALEQMCLFNVISVQDMENHVPLKTVLERLTKKAQAGNMRAIAALGAVSVVLHEREHEEQLASLVDQLRSLHEIRQAETQFAVGEALSCVACAWDCQTLVSTFDMSGSCPSGPDRTVTTLAVLDKVFEDSTSNKPALKKASVIWLLCFLQFCSSHAETQKRLPQFQRAFKRCLSDRDELVQESASRGLGLVYEKGNRELKNDLVRDLVSSFSGDKSAISGTVGDDTQLFEPGALPTGEGDKSITTYKDIMSLASEVGDSSLVYKFMSLASNNAIWSSRAAFGRFGLSNVLSDSSVDGYLAENPKLYPKLFRYRFDANTSVRRSMNDIWNSLVKDSAATIELYFDAIIDDLLINIVGREWRTRQASCAAIADLVQGRKLERIQPYIDRCWSLCFKVLDDIKASVRTSAAELARVLTGMLLRNLEAPEGKTDTINSMLKSVLPFLLSTSGLESMAKDVQETSLRTLLQIIKQSRESILRPFIPELVERLLGMLSTFEPEAINYVHMNASQYNMKQEEIDDLRLKSIRSSPLMEAIERCLDQSDEATIKLVVPRLQHSLKTAVSLPTKVGCSRVLVSLSTRRAFVFRPFADQFLESVSKRIVDRNPTVSSSYCTAMGYLARSSKDAIILQAVTSAKTLYFASEEDHTRLVMGDMIHAIAKHATDRFNGVASDILPFVFLAAHDSDESVRKVFRETWDETVGGARAASLYLNEITQLASEHLESRRWGVKHAAMLTIAECVTLIAKAQGHVNEQQCLTLWPALKLSIAGRHWRGKEKVLDAYDLLEDKGTTNAQMKHDIKELADKVERARKKAKEEAEDDQA
ncbi:MAG: proteasome component M29 [Chrysothrix sp. TS-e1954]|nr:MAG: proteasome component M29 [Chrysothrix sp. TS-e1954]